VQAARLVRVFELAKHHLGRALLVDPENQKARGLLADIAAECP
jgi:hypothetical protein